MPEITPQRPPTNGWDVLKIAVICCTVMIAVNMGLASNLADLSEVKSGGLGAVISFIALAGMKRYGVL